MLFCRIQSKGHCRSKPYFFSFAALILTAVISVINSEVSAWAWTAYALNTEQRGTTKPETEVEEIRFSFHPRWREEVLEDMFLTLRADGHAHAVMYDYDRSKVTATYKGILPKADVSRLIARVQETIREANRRKTSDGVIREGDLFYLSIKPKSGAAGEIGGVVADVPEANALIEDLRVLWKRLKKTPLADAYVRSNPIDKDRLALLLNEGKLRFTSIQNLPRELQLIVRNAINKSFDFHPLSQTQSDQLRTYASYGEVYITDSDAGYKLILFSSQPQSIPNK